MVAGQLSPSGSTLRVSFWYRKADGKKLHPRFIMTEYGGVQVDYGLDEGDSVGDTTIVSLMDHDLWQVVRGDYGLDPARAPAFDKSPEKGEGSRLGAKLISIKADSRWRSDS